LSGNSIMDDLILCAVAEAPDASHPILFGP
jgi:hypothetical protein